MSHRFTFPGAIPQITIKVLLIRCFVTGIVNWHRRHNSGMRHRYTDLLETRPSREFKYRLVLFKSPCFLKFIHYFLMCSVCAYIGVCVCVGGYVWWAQADIECLPQLILYITSITIVIILRQEQLTRLMAASSSGLCSQPPQDQDYRVYFGCWEHEIRFSGLPGKHWAKCCLCHYWDSRWLEAGSWWVSILIYTWVGDLFHGILNPIKPTSKIKPPHLPNMFWSGS